MRERRDPVTFNSSLVESVAQRTIDPQEMELGACLDIQQQLNRALAQLSPLCPTIVVMKKRDGLSIEEIAHELNLSIHTVKKYLTRCPI